MVKNVTLSVEEEILKKARQKALAQHKTLNALFREWIAQYVDAGQNRAQRYYELMDRLKHVDFGAKKFTREEMNER